MILVNGSLMTTDEVVAVLGQSPPQRPGTHTEATGQLRCAELARMEVLENPALEAEKREHNRGVGEGEVEAGLEEPALGR